LLAAGLWLFPASGRSQTSAEPLDLSGTEEDVLLRTAGDLFEQQRFPAAGKNYQDFLKRYPKHARHAEAGMMFAESLYRQALAAACGTRMPAGSAASEVCSGAAALQSVPTEETFREARKAYESALRMTQRDDLLTESIEYRLAEIDFDLRRHEDVVRACSKLMADHPGGLLRGEARLLQAQSLLALQRPAEAAALLAAALRDQTRYEQDPRMRLAYGAALFSMGNSSGALVYLEKQDSPLAHLYAGRAMLSEGKPLLAIEHFLQVPKLDRDGPYVELSRYLSAESFFAAKDYRSALNAYEQFLHAYPQSRLKPGTMFKIGFSQYELQEYLAARGSFQSVLQLAADNEFAPLSLYMTAETFMQERRFKEAGFAYADMAASFSGPLAGNAQFKLAWTFFQQGELSSAEAAARQMLIKHPGHALAPISAMLLGDILTRNERYGDAVLAYQRALDMLPDAPLSQERKTEIREACLALLNRANLLGKDYGRLVSGYRYLMQEIKPSLHPWRAVTLLILAEGCFRQGLYDEALAIYKNVLKSYPANPDAAYAVDGIAWCLFKKGEYAQAEEFRRKLEEYRSLPKVAAAKTVLSGEQVGEGLFTASEFEMATIRFNQKKYLEALEAYEAFEKKHPNDPLAAQAALQMGWCAYRLEYYGQSIKTWERVETTYPQSPAAAQAAWATADTYFRAGQYEKAIAVYRRIVETYRADPAVGHARLRIAQSYYNGKEILKAIGAFEEILNAAPESAESGPVLDFLTQLLYREDSRPQALEALGRVAETNPNAPLAARARLRIAKNAFEGRDYPEAVKQLEPLTTRLMEAGEQADAQFMLAEAYYNLQRYKDAAWAYDRFTTNYPGDERHMPALFHLGASRFKLEDHAGAAQAFQAVREKYPKASYAPVALFNSALAYRKLGRWEDAALALKNYKKDYPEAAKTSNASAELLAVYEEHRQYAAAIETLLEERETLPEDDARRLELTYRLGEDYAALEKENEAVAAYESLAANPMKGNAYRLSALAKLGEIYEKRALWDKALAIYDDLSRSAARGDWAEAAKARAEAVREKLRSAAPSNAASPAEPQPAHP
jgi:TolA-binding protein